MSHGLTPPPPPTPPPFVYSSGSDVDDTIFVNNVPFLKKDKEKRSLLSDKISRSWQLYVVSLLNYDKFLQ